MGSTKALFRLLIVVVLIAAAEPAIAEKDQKPQQASKTAQTKKCVTTAPPFMRNPRFMNRGFLKKKPK